MEFEDGEVKELTANVTTERMYAQCEKHGNDMLLLNGRIFECINSFATSGKYG